MIPYNRMLWKVPSGKTFGGQDAALTHASALIFAYVYLKTPVFIKYQ
jgi:hypothetical protein